MAQVLKDEQRNKILNSAKAEFAKNGLKQASLREIAKNADMTVGNLYRYFKNKQTLADTILNPLTSELDAITATMLSTQSNNAENTDTIIMDEQILKHALIALADCMVELEDKHRLEMLILINDDDINHSKNIWLNKIVTQILISANMPSIKTEQQLQIFSTMLSSAIFSGLREGIQAKCNTDMNKEDFKTVLRLYLSQCIMLFKLA